MSLSKALLRLREKASHLNTVADAATRALATVETFLQRSNIGIPMGVQIRDGVQLSFVKMRNEFRLVLDHEAADSYLPWQETSREEKILAAAHLQPLIEQILAEIERQTAQTLDDETVNEIARVAKAIEAMEEGSANG
jgi:hypothetical protein